MTSGLDDIAAALRGVAKRRSVTVRELDDIIACGELRLAADVEAVRALGGDAINDALFLHRLSVAASTANMILMFERQAKGERADL
jgi:hypothetical protein